MERVIKWLEKTEEYVSMDYDRVIPVIGDEGMGKSTFLLQLGWLWLDITGREPAPASVMDQIAWDRDQFKHMLADKPPKSCIMVHDAARVLSRKKAMHGSQIETEEDMLDMRFANHIVLLGYQEFDLVPTVVADRRAKNLLRIPDRGIVHGHNESNIRKRYEDDRWPDPVMRDTFPDLEGTALWRAFKDEDAQRKRERIKPDEDDSDEELSIKELADKIVDDGIRQVVSLHGGHNRLYIDSDLIEVEYAVSGQKAKKTAKLLKKRRAEGEIHLGGGEA